MKTFKEELELIANVLLSQNAQAVGNENKPNYSNRDFMNALIIFQTAIYDKTWDNMDFDNMPYEERVKMSVKLGTDLRDLIFTYTNLDTHKIQDFL